MRWLSLPMPLLSGWVGLSLSRRLHMSCTCRDRRIGMGMR
jgi:hypothetical protein